MKDTVKNPIKEIERFALDRNIHKMEYNYFDYVASILEELVELAGGDVPKEKRDILKEGYNNFLIYLRENDVIPEELVVSSDDTRIDAIADITVFSLTELMKLKTDPSLVLEEVAKEINSRKGEIKNGKFEKYTDDKHKKLWYKADFSKTRKFY